MNMYELTFLKQEFYQAYSCEPQVVAYAPGRVNLIGDHTDYNDGWVLPAAVNFGTHVLANPRNDRQIRVIAKDYNDESVCFDLASISFNQQVPWSNYVAGVLNELMIAGIEINGADLWVCGNVPQGAGLSSSASFEIAVVKAFSLLFNFDISGELAAKIGQRAENRFVGCNCGIMDQFISALGRQGQAMLLDCRELSYQYASIPNDMAIMIVNSNVKRELVDSEYNIRRQQCEQVAKFFNKKALREVSLADLEQAQADLEPQLFRRAWHVVSENARTLRAYTALNNHDIHTLSQLMADSHASLRNDFEVTTPELDLLVEILSAVLGENGGARMTGGGFGGCVVALVPTSMVDVATAAVETQYPEKTGITPDIYLCTAETGAFTA
ncbi:galactokinase [Thalassotalea fusca]